MIDAALASVPLAGHVRAVINTLTHIIYFVEIKTFDVLVENDMMTLDDVQGCSRFHGLRFAASPSR